MSQTSGSKTLARPEELILDALQVEAIPVKPLDGEHGVTFKTLWEDRSHRTFAGIMHLAPGAALRPHAHPYSVHHAWVIDGECVIHDRVLGRGAYCYVPAGAEHGIVYAGLFGCTLLYVYERAEID